MIKATFFMEQHIGHYAYYQNLRSSIDRQVDIEANWVEVTYTDQDSLLARTPLLPAQLKGALIGRSQVRKGLKKNVDVYFFNTQTPAALAAKISQRPPYFLATDITPLQYDSMGEHYGHRPDRDGLIASKIGSLKHRRNTRVFQRAQTIFPWSSWAGKSLVNDYGVDPRKIEIIAPGVNLDLWRPGFVHENQPFRILFVGGDFLRKGGAVLLEAYQALSKLALSRPVELILVTRSTVPLIPGVKVHTDIRPNSPEIIGYYQTSDLFILPTFAEAFGIAAVEATAAGLPVIATQVGGLTDIVEDGQTGFLIQPGEVQVIVEKCIQLIENPELLARMGRQGRARAEMLFDASRNSSRIVQHLQEAVLQQ